MTQPDFIIVPTQVLAEKSLQPLDSKVFGYIYWLEKLKDGKCTASNATLAELSNSKATSVGHSLARLEAAGFILRHYSDAVALVRDHIECLVGFQRMTPSSDEHTPLSNEQGTPLSNEQHKKSSNKKSIKTGTKVPGATPINAPVDKVIEIVDNPERPDRRDPEVTEAVEHFMTLFQLRLTRMPAQRRAAKTLIGWYKLDGTLRLIEAAAACRGRKYAPVILSLEDLRQKANNLAEYWRREKTSNQVPEAI